MKQQQALSILKSGINVFLTGEPGSGKTYVLNQYVAYLRSHSIETAVTASTGIAATHIGGMTIHSWSGIGIKNALNKFEIKKIAGNDYVKKRVKKAKVLIIDEISMLPPETLQMVDSICREVKQVIEPFGGMQVVFVGDFFQLPPVSKRFATAESQESLFEDAPMRFAFQSPIWQQAELTSCYLSEQHRQNDDDLLFILSKIRNNTFDDESLAILSERKTDSEQIPSDAPRLHTHNVDVDAVNNRMLSEIPGETRFFPMTGKGHPALLEVMKKGCLSPEHLYLKIGASVMFTKNNAKEHYANGTLGTVESFDPESGLPIILTKGKHRVKVTLAEWAVEEEGKIKGKLCQLPLRLAWAITIHKSQGTSLDEAVVDLSRVFEFGQGYVALSRVRNLAGIHLLGWNETAFLVDDQVMEMEKEFVNESHRAERRLSKLSSQEIDRLYQDFIQKCGGSLEISSRKKSKPITGSSRDKTLEMFKAGVSLKQIAQSRNLSHNTILSHIEELARDGLIEKSDLLPLLPKKLLSDLPTIHGSFKKLKTLQLSPVYKDLKGKYRYDDLKLARLLI